MIVLKHVHVNNVLLCDAWSVQYSTSFRVDKKYCFPYSIAGGCVLAACAWIVKSLPATWLWRKVPFDAFPIEGIEASRRKQISSPSFVNDSTFTHRNGDMYVQNKSYFYLWSITPVIISSAIVSCMIFLVRPPYSPSFANTIGYYRDRVVQLVTLADVQTQASNFRPPNSVPIPPHEFFPIYQCASCAGAIAAPTVPHFRHFLCVYPVIRNCFTHWWKYVGSQHGCLHLWEIYVRVLIRNTLDPRFCSQSNRVSGKRFVGWDAVVGRPRNHTTCCNLLRCKVF